MSTVTAIPYGFVGSHRGVITVIPHPEGKSAFIVENVRSPGSNTAASGIYYVGPLPNGIDENWEEVKYGRLIFERQSSFVEDAIRRTLPEALQKTPSHCIFRIGGSMPKEGTVATRDQFEQFSKRPNNQYSGFYERAAQLEQADYITAEMREQAIAAVCGEKIDGAGNLRVKEPTKASGSRTR